MRMSFSLRDNRRFFIAESVVELLLAYRQLKKNQKEAGGLLIGRHLREQDHLIVDQITEPISVDKRLRRFFFRSNSHNKALVRAWQKSDKTQTLLGLWHTHPEPIPVPSKEDFQDWSNTLFRGEYWGEFLVFIIVGTKEIKLWKGDKYAQFSEMERIS